ncbi:MAG: hypothetical protein PWQ55_2502 [Chloroflexota bacterium]|nr:hypothetical protein [Chloroflexota bacterium]
MKIKISKFIGIISVAPLVSFYMLVALYFHDRSVLGDFRWFALSVFFLTLLPISAYLLEHILPNFKTAGRKGERRLAFIMCILGYVLGTLTSYLFHAPKGIQLFFTSYLMSGGLLAVVNGLFKYKASGHACGVAGPYVALLYFFGLKYWYFIFLLIPVFWARLAMGRHTLKQLLSGAAIAMTATAATIMVFTYV